MQPLHLVEDAQLRRRRPARGIGQFIIYALALVGPRGFLGHNPTLFVALAGIACGVLAAVFAGRALASFVFGVGTADPLTLAGVSLVLLVVAATASYVPSRRALNVNPVTALLAD